MIFQHLTHRRGSNQKLSRNWYSADFATLGMKGASMPAVFTEGVRITKDGRIENPDIIPVCHKMHDDIRTVRHLRSRMFYSTKFSPAD